MYKIGISACFMYADKNRTSFWPKTLSYVENDMMAYVCRKDIMPVMIPDISDECLQGILHELDGFVLQGGVDVAPQSYGEEPIGSWLGDAYRDQYELKIIDFAIKQSKPILAICRGCQLLNVYFGGSLYQDISTQRPDSKTHRSEELYDKLKHSIVFLPGNILHDSYKNCTDPYINSVHHQAIKNLGEDLKIYAKAHDGIIEAFGYEQEPPGKVMGVQWHPEFSQTLEAEVIDAKKIYDIFLRHVCTTS